MNLQLCLEFENRIVTQPHRAAGAEAADGDGRAKVEQDQREERRGDDERGGERAALDVVLWWLRGRVVAGLAAIGRRW